MANGKPIKKRMLQHSDEIEIGKYQLKYVSEAAENTATSGSPEDFEKTMIIRPAAMKAMTPENDAAKMQASNIQPPACS